MAIQSCDPSIINETMEARLHDKQAQIAELQAEIENIKRILACEHDAKIGGEMYTAVKCDKCNCEILLGY